MNTVNEFTPEYLDKTARALFIEERAVDYLDGWFIAREAVLENDEYKDLSPESRAARR